MPLGSSGTGKRRGSCWLILPIVPDRGRGHSRRARGGGVPASGRASARTNRCTEHRPDGAGGVLPQLPVALVPGGGGGARARAQRRAGARDRLRNTLRAMEVALPVRALVRLLIVLGCLAAVVGCGRGDDEHQARGDDVVLTPEAAAKARAVAGAERSARRSRARAVKLEGAGAAREGSPGVAGDAPSPGAPSDAQVRAELRQAREALADFRKHLDTTAFLATGPRARVL